jgi:acid phosphatase family membrane protein YuiD
MGLSEGVHTPLFAIAVPRGVLVMLDAMHLRRAVGAPAAARNDVLQGDPRGRPFQARVGHRPGDVLMGLLGGIGGACV